MRINLVGSTAFKSMAVVISGEDEAKAIKDVTGAHMQGLGTVNYETGSQWVIATGETDKNLLTKLCGQVKDEFEKTGRKVYAVFETGDFEGKTTYFKLWQEKLKIKTYSTRCRGSLSFLYGCYFENDSRITL